ncbi:hypothetical protein EDB87DRAFT_1673893 [Lactarius vividus]|nr:hypothetical protein EDB87DRAFT_1673893 [Lactarius vividus]
MQATYPLSAPPSPIRSRRIAPMPGFRVPPKPKPPPIGELTIRELRDLYERNAKILATPAPSTSTYVPRIMAEQAKIEAQLLELEGMQDIQVGLELARISEDEQMRVDVAPEQPRPIEAKLRALDKFGNTFRGEKVVQGLSFEEAAELEQRAHAADLERKQRLLERNGKSRASEREEQEARIWAFMNYKPSESDLEDDDGDDLEDEDPSTWFDDDQDDGRKDQDIIEPDVEDLSDIIRVDTSRIYYNTCYES